MIHNLELNPLCHTKNEKKINHITSRTFSQENKEITYTTLATSKTKEKNIHLFDFFKTKEKKTKKNKKRQTKEMTTLPHTYITHCPQ